MQDFAASAGDPMKLTLIKGNYFALNEDFAASAGDPMKFALVKGNYFALDAGFCCLCR